MSSLSRVLTGENVRRPLRLSVTPCASLISFSLSLSLSLSLPYSLCCLLTSSQTVSSFVRGLAKTCVQRESGREEREGGGGGKKFLFIFLFFTDRKLLLFNLATTNLLCFFAVAGMSSSLWGLNCPFSLSRSQMKVFSSGFSYYHSVKIFFV